MEILTQIQKEKFLRVSGVEFSADLNGRFFTSMAKEMFLSISSLSGQFETSYPNKRNKFSPWIFTYIIEEETGNLICELVHRMTNNRTYGWDKLGNELPREILHKYFPNEFAFSDSASIEEAIERVQKYIKECKERNYLEQMTMTTKALQKKAEELRIQADTLSKVSIEWQTSISIDCADLTKDKADEIIGMLDKSKSKNPAIYYFEIIGYRTEEDEDIVSRLKEYKDKKERACPKIKERPESDYLYVGSVKKIKLQDRLKQHLGFLSRQTYSLQLSHWAKDLELELKFHYAWLDEINLTELVESAIAEELKPLVGKMA